MTKSWTLMKREITKCLDTHLQEWAALKEGDNHKEEII